METEIFDNHTLYLRFGDKNENEIRQFVESIVPEIKNVTKLSEVHYRINVPFGKDGVPFGYAFVYFLDEKAYYSLVGLNLDGSERCEYIPDPNFIDSDKEEEITRRAPFESSPINSFEEPEYNPDQSMSPDQTTNSFENSIDEELIKNKEISATKNFLQNEEEDDGEEFDQRIYDSFTYKEFSPKKESIITENIPKNKTSENFTFSVLKSCNWADMSDDDHENNIYVPPKPSPNVISKDTPKKKIPLIKVDLEPLVKILDTEDDHWFNVSAAVCKPLDKFFAKNVLKTKNVPISITEEMLKKIFYFYAIESNKIFFRKSTQEIMSTKDFFNNKNIYPRIKIDDYRNAFVTFLPETNDAMFALHMTKKLILPSGEKLMFEHAKNKDVHFLYKNNYNNSYKRPYHHQNSGSFDNSKNRNNKNQRF